MARGHGFCSALRSPLAAAALAALALAGTAAAAPTVAVEDPTPGGTFTGRYVASEDDDSTPEDEYREATQEGYVGVYVDGDNSGVVACNGNPGLRHPEDGSPLVGYVWIGPGQAASNDFGSAPGGAAGAGSNHLSPDGTGSPTGESPCPDSEVTTGAG